MSIIERVTLGVLLFCGACVAETDSTIIQEFSVDGLTSFVNSFVESVKGTDIERSASYVWPEDSTGFRAEVPKMAPMFPDSVQLVDIILKQDSTADCNIANSNGLGFDLKYSENRWWITK